MDAILFYVFAAVAVASAVWLPSARSVVTSIDHVPSAAAVAMPTRTPSTVTSTVAPGAAVPEIVGVVSEVVEPLAGATMSTVVVASTVNVVSARAVWPAASPSNSPPSP